ncbi:hypothetical protein CRUP_031893 [Coryphaenoides rupestris]|nr:hypothetical protein CRUP_031893 [Coryphaenoides rupestris]
MKSILMVPQGLNEDKAAHFSKQWGDHSTVLSRRAVGQTLTVNQLVDMEWKFGGRGYTGSRRAVWPGGVPRRAAA